MGLCLDASRVMVTHSFLRRHLLERFVTEAKERYERLFGAMMQLETERRGREAIRQLHCREVGESPCEL